MIIIREKLLRSIYKIRNLTIALVLISFLPAVGYSRSLGKEQIDLLFTQGHILSIAQMKDGYGAYYHMVRLGKFYFCKVINKPILSKENDTLEPNVSCYKF